MTRSTSIYSFALAALLFGCGSGDDGAGAGQTTDGAGSSSSSSGGSGGGAAEDLDMTEADFECILDWTAVHNRITNKLGHQDEAIAVANSADGGVYPVGTIIQLIPTEAMVKRRAGFSAATKDWEFFFLDVTGKQTTIKARGAGEVVNGFGGNCLNCHSLAKPQWDLICEDSHGCDPLPFTAEQIKMVQDSDSRCVP